MVDQVVSVYNALDCDSAGYTQQQGPSKEERPA